MKKVLIGAIVLLLLSGCVPQAVKAPEMLDINRSNDRIKAYASSGSSETNATTTLRWWVKIGDARLENLIEKAIAEAPKLSVARSRISQARAEYGLSQTQTEPSLSLTASADKNRPSRHDLISPPLVPTIYNTGRIGVGLEYDLDLWGRLDAAVRAKLGLLHAKEAEYDKTVLLLSTAIADEYFHYGYLQDESVLLNDREKALSEELMIAQERFRAGLEREDNVIFLKAQQTKYTLARMQVDTALLASKRALSDLAGMDTASVETFLPKSFAPSPLFATMPTVMLENLAYKPEIRLKKELVTVASADLDQAEAGFYPNINLSAMAGYASLGLSNLLRADSKTASAGVGISLPIFDRNALKDNYQAFGDARAAAIYDYNSAVIASGNETLWALSTLVQRRNETHTAKNALVTSAQHTKLTKIRFEKGISDKSATLSARLDEIEYRRAFLSSQLDETLSYISVIRSTGGAITKGVN